MTIQVEEHVLSESGLTTWLQEKAEWETELLKTSDPAVGQTKMSKDVRYPYEAKRPEGKRC